MSGSILCICNRESCNWNTRPGMVYDPFHPPPVHPVPPIQPFPVQPIQPLPPVHPIYRQHRDYYK